MPLILRRNDNKDRTAAPMSAGQVYGTCRDALEQAWAEGCESIELPLDHTEAGALESARLAITGFLEEHDMDVYLLIDNSESVAGDRTIYAEIDEYIEENYAAYIEEPVFAHPDLDWTGEFTDEMLEELTTNDEPEVMHSCYSGEPDAQAGLPQASQSRPHAAARKVGSGFGFGSLDDWIRGRKKHESETFHQMLFRLIDESGMSYPQVYTRANMSKKLFSKIKLNPDSTPKKKNIIALAIALRLDMEQTEELLMKAGYALSNSSMADVIVSYFIETRTYDVFKVNEALFEYGLENDLLGF